MDEKTSSNNNQEERMMDASIVVIKAILLENVDYQGGALKGIWPPPHGRKSSRRLTLVKKSGMLKLGFLKKLKRMSWRRTWKHLLLQ